MLPTSYLLQKIRRVFFIALPLSVILLFLFPASSKAQAILLRSDPIQNAVLNSAPTRVHMWFSEDLNSGISTATVVNASNRRIDLGNAHISPDDTHELDVALQPLVSPGTYSVLWTTQSADDGYISQGSFIFSVTEPNGTVPKTNAVLPGQNSTHTSNQLDGPTFFSFMMVTLVDLGAVFWMGAQLWRIFVLQLTGTKSSEQETVEQRTEIRFDRKFSFPLLLLLLLANIGVIVGQVLTLTSEKASLSFTLSTLITLSTSGRFGTYWMMREIVILLAMILAAISLTLKNISQRVIDIISWLNLLLGMALLLTLTLSGHASAANSEVLAYSIMLDWLHFLAASLWIGCMLYISILYLPMLKGNALLERVRSLITTLPHYAALAITGIIILAVTGPFNATVHMSSFDQLTTTAYGRALIVKSILVAALMVTSALHIGLLRPRLAKSYKKSLALVNVGQHETITIPKSEKATIQPVAQESIKLLEARMERQSKGLTTLLRWESVLGVAVLVCTGLMSVFAGTLQPTAASQAELLPQIKTFTTTAKTSDTLFTIKLAISPDSSGPNTFTVTTLASHGVDAAHISVSIYATMLDMDMGTDMITLQPDGKGNFSAPANLDMGGHWGLRVVIRTPDLKLHSASVKIVATN